MRLTHPSRKGISPQSFFRCEWCGKAFQMFKRRHHCSQAPERLTDEAAKLTTRT